MTPPVPSTPQPGDETEPPKPKRRCIVCTLADLDAISPPRHQTCGQCAEETAKTLRDFLAVLVTLPRAYWKSGTAQGERVRGSRERPVPGGDALTILGPGRDVTIGHTAPDIWHADDPEPAVSMLTGWEDDWRDIREDEPRSVQPWESSKGDRLSTGGTRDAISVAVTAAAAYLRLHNDWAAEYHPAYDEYANHLTEIKDRTERTLRVDTLVHKLPVKCPHCDGRLARDDGADRVRCRKCHNSWTEQEYLWLTVILASEEAAAGRTGEEPTRKPRIVRHGVTLTGSGFIRCACGFLGYGQDSYDEHLPETA